MGRLDLELEPKPLSNLSFCEPSLPEFPEEPGDCKLEDEESWRLLQQQQQYFI